MVTSPEIERKKLLTRSRHCLLNANILTGEAATALGARGLTELPLIGPGMAHFILAIAANPESSDYAEIFPYPEGLGDTRYRVTSSDTANESPATNDDVSFLGRIELDLSEIDPLANDVPVQYLYTLMGVLDAEDPTAAMGYLQALIDVAEGDANISRRVLEKDRAIRREHERHQLQQAVESLRDTADTLTTPFGSVPPVPPSWDDIRRKLEADEIAPIRINLGDLVNGTAKINLGHGPSQADYDDGGC